MIQRSQDPSLSSPPKGTVRVLHLFSNYKWTGPADPAVSLAAALQEDGVEIVFRASGYIRTAPENYLEIKARAKGLEVLTDLQLSKHISWFRNRGDVKRLSNILQTEPFSLVHSHQKNDFRIARRAVARASQKPGGVGLVRTIYDTEPEQVTPALGEDLRQSADAVIVFSRAMENRLQELGYPEDRLHRIEPSIDLERFSPQREVGNLREELGLSSDDFVAGVVARVQPQRRFDLLLDMAEAVSQRHPNFKLVVIGRGSNLEWVGREPARERGLLDRVVFFPGFFEGDRYVQMLRSLDVKLFMVPGTDGTARAVREALALGLPVVCTKRGMLPELVLHQQTGWVCDETPESFSAAMVRFVEDPNLVARLGQQAHKDANERFCEKEQVARVRAIYDQVLARSQSS